MMIGTGMNQENWANSLSEQEKTQMRAVVTLAGAEFEELVRRMGLPRAHINGTSPSNVLVLLDSASLHVVFEKTPNPVTTINMAHQGADK